MRKYIIALCLLLWSLTPAASRDVVITDDGGGVISQYIWTYALINNRGDRVVINGWCASACTIALHYPTTCVTKRAILGFHQAYYENIFTGEHIISKQNSDLLYSYYPPKIKQWIRDHGGLKPSLLIMGPTTARKLLPNC